jgi:hypothetical protein
MDTEGIKKRLSLFTTEIKELNQLLDLSLRGMSIGSKFRPFLEGAYEDSSDKTDVRVKELYTKIMAKLSSDEEMYEIQKSENFTKTIEMYIVYLWSKIDNIVEDVLVDYIILDESLLSFEKIADIKLPLSFILLDDRGKRNYLVAEVKRKLNSPLKQGVGKFESLLEAFGLGGDIPKKLKDKIYELSNIRNVIVHSNSFADERLIANCPHLEYNLGDRLALNIKDFHAYSRAIIGYVLIIATRLQGKNLPEGSLAEWKKE